MTKVLSIAICSYNRADQLAITLDSLVSHKVELQPDDEIILIDNNSNDHTKGVYQQYAEQLPLVYCFAAKQGLAVARNLALEKFCTDAVIFIDDDITIKSGFIKAYRQALSELPNNVFLGGPIEVDWRGKQPKWYRSGEHPLLSGLVGDYNLGSALLQYSIGDLLPYGANFVLSRESVEVVGAFDENLGVRGDTIERGEESDYFERALQKGLNGYYVPAAQVSHRFQLDRINTIYLLRYGMAKGRTSDFDSRQTMLQTVLEILKLLPKSAYQLLKWRIANFYQCVINLGIQVATLVRQVRLNKNE